MHQLTTMTVHMAVLLNFKWPYHAAVINKLEQSNNTIGFHIPLLYIIRMACVYSFYAKNAIKKPSRVFCLQWYIKNTKKVILFI